MTIPMDVLFVNQFVAHYREPVMRLLSSHEKLSIRSISGPRALSGNVPVANLQDCSGMRVTLNATSTRLGPISWQRHVISACFLTRADAVVLTGDVHVLSTWVAAAVLRARHVPTLMWTHGWTHLDHGITRVIRNAFYGLSDALLVYGSDAVSFGRASGFRGRMYVVGNSMGAEVVSTDNLQPKHDSQQWLVISRLFAKRRIDEVIRQVRRLRDEGKEVVLTIVGDGQEGPALRALATDLGVHVTFTGAIYNPNETAALLDAADIVLSPGHVGLAAVHALSRGCPVSTHNRVDRQMPEHAAVIDGVTGVRFPYGDYVAMADRTWAFVDGADPLAVHNACRKEVLANWTPAVHARRIADAIVSEVDRRRVNRSASFLPWRRPTS